jgi:hypothetical protein
VLKLPLGYPSFFVQKAYKAVVNCIVISVIVIDVVAPQVYPPIAHAGMAASVTVAGAFRR